MHFKSALRMGSFVKLSLYLPRQPVVILSVGMPDEIYPGGEIGRRTSLRGWRPYGCGSSNLLLGTAGL
jgi:hypothetical protein